MKKTNLWLFVFIFLLLVPTVAAPAPVDIQVIGDEFNYNANDPDGDVWNVEAQEPYGSQIHDLWVSNPHLISENFPCNPDNGIDGCRVDARITSKQSLPYHTSQGEVLQLEEFIFPAIKTASFCTIFSLLSGSDLFMHRIALEYTDDPKFFLFVEVNHHCTNPSTNEWKLSVSVAWHNDAGDFFRTLVTPGPVINPGDFLTINIRAWDANFKVKVTAHFQGTTWSSTTLGGVGISSRDGFVRIFSDYRHNSRILTDYIRLALPSLSLTASPSTVPADGTSASTVTATTSDAVAGVQVSFSTTLGTLSSSSCVTGADGSCAVSVSSSVAGAATVTASALEYITGQSSVAFSGFSLDASPSSLAVLPGSSATSTIGLTSIDGFAGSVSLTVSIAPVVANGPIASLSPSTVTLTSGGSATTTLSLSTTSSTPTGSYSVAVTGVSGSLSRSTTVSVSMGDFSISASPSSSAVQAGTAGTSTVTLTSLGGFSNNVSVTTSVSPAVAEGPTVNPTQTTVSLASGGTSSFVLTLSTLTSTPEQSYAVTVTGTSSSLVHSITISVLVTAPPPPPTYVVPATFIQTGGISGSQITALVSMPVSLQIRLSSSTTMSGRVTIEARRDLVGFPDNTLVSLASVITLSPGTNVIGMGTFTPPELTGEAVGQVRQYFIRISWGVSGNYIYDPTDPNTREWVKTTGSDFSISANSTSIGVVREASSAASITLTSRGGFADTVSLTTVVSPSGSSSPTASLSASSVSLTSGGSSSVTLTIATTTNTSVGSYQVTVTGIVGSLVRSVAVSITVNNQVPQWPSGSSLSNTKHWSSADSAWKITLNWPQATDDQAVTGYNVYFSDFLVATLPASQTSYVDLLGPYDGYATYDVYATDGDSGLSVPLSVTFYVGCVRGRPCPLAPPATQGSVSGDSGLLDTDGATGSVRRPEMSTDRQKIAFH